MFLLFPQFKSHYACLGESLIIAVIIQICLIFFGYQYEIVPHIMLILCIGYFAGMAFGNLLVKVLSEYFDITKF